jgi:hypothetical protein
MTTTRWEAPRAGGAARLAVKEAGIPLQIDFTGLADTSCTEALGRRGRRGPVPA